MMHGAEQVTAVLRLRQKGLSALEISRRTGVARSTVRDWLAGRLPRDPRRADLRCDQCGGAAHDVANLPPEYVYLLGMYLGDGYIASHRRGVHKLRVTLDTKYPGIISECETAMRAVAPRNAVRRRHRIYNDTEVYSSDIRDLFRKVCSDLDLNSTTSGTVVYVSRIRDVARLDEWVGPKR